MPQFPYSNVNHSYPPPPTFAAISKTPLGNGLWGFLIRPEMVRSKIVAVRLGKAPVSGISDALLAEFGSSDLSLDNRARLFEGLQQRFPGQSFTLDRVKQLIGSMIKAILTNPAIGLKLKSTTSAARDPEGIFTRSARYIT